MPRSKLTTSLIATATLVACAATAPLIHAQLNDDEGVKTGPTPTFTGKGKVTEAINGDLGALFDIGAGVTMLFPKGLPVGRSRLVTLQKAKGRLPTQLIEKFKPQGPALEFTGAFNTAGKPMVLSVPSSKDPAGRGQKLVLAMEVGTFCENENKAFKLKGGLCSGFELHDAQWEPGDKRMVARLQSTGGLRMQFGAVPEGDE
jgi:hypothetical protein